MKSRALIILIIFIVLSFVGFFVFFRGDSVQPDIEKKENETEGEIRGGKGNKEIEEVEEISTTPPEIPANNQEILEIPEAPSVSEVLSTPTPTPTPSTPKLLSWQRETGIRVRGAVSSSTIFISNQYWMYYTGIGGIFLAKSADGLNFQEYGRVLNNKFDSEPEVVTNPSIFQLKNGKYRMIYEGSINQQSIRKLYSAVSEDGLKWIEEDGVRLEDSTIETKNGKNQELIFTSVPDVIRLKNDCLRMYYTVVDESRIAESCDEGLTWQKKGKIMFDLYPEVVQDPDIIQLADGKYKLFFSTQDSGRTRQWILSALSEDGFNFIIDNGKRIEPLSGRARAVDPDVIKLPKGNYRIYYGESLVFEGDFDIFSAVSED